jgi:hypothetical protein
MRKLLALACLVALVGATDALASGTLYDNGVLQFTFGDQTGYTPISADNDGTYIWTASGGGGNPLGRYNQDGSPNGYYPVGLDFRSLFVSNGGQLYGKMYCGDVYSISQSGVPTYMFNLGGDPDCQSSGSFNADDTEIYTMAAPTITRFNAANGSMLGSFTLNGMNGNEFNYPASIQMETNADGRILTFADGVVSEWDLGGNRVGQCTVPIGSPFGFNTSFSFGVGNDNMVYLINENTGQWEVYDVGVTGNPTAVEETSWGAVKALYR